MASASLDALGLLAQSSPSAQPMRARPLARGPLASPSAAARSQPGRAAPARQVGCCGPMTGSAGRGSLPARSMAPFPLLAASRRLFPTPGACFMAKERVGKGDRCWRVP